MGSVALNTLLALVAQAHAWPAVDDEEVSTTTTTTTRLLDDDEMFGLHSGFRQILRIQFDVENFKQRSVKAM